MQRLILMRHAEAMGNALSGRDRDRALSPRGRIDATRIGEALAARGVRPDTALISPAVRTSQTWDLVREVTGNATLHLEDALYNAPAETLRSHVEQVGTGAGCLILVAHNPGIHQLAMDLLSGAKTVPAGARHLAAGFPPAAAAIFSIGSDGRPEFESWLDPADLT